MQLKKILTTATYAICLSLIMTPQAQAVEKGLASYYAHKFQGRKTANGQRYDKRKFTEKFNLNLLNVINKKLKIKIKLNDFKYISTYNKKKKCMENFIISKKNQSFNIKNQKIYFKKNEKIQTEISNKFTISKFKSIIKATGWKLKKYWTDQKKYYAVFLLES